MQEERQSVSSCLLVYFPNALMAGAPATGNASHKGGREPIIWAVATASQGLQRQEAGIQIRSWSEESNSELWFRMWDPNPCL